MIPGVDELSPGVPEYALNGGENENTSNRAGRFAARIDTRLGMASHASLSADDPQITRVDPCSTGTGDTAGRRILGVAVGITQLGEGPTYCSQFFRYRKRKRSLMNKSLRRSSSKVVFTHQLPIQDHHRQNKIAHYRLLE